MSNGNDNTGGSDDAGAGGNPGNGGSGERTHNRIGITPVIRGRPVTINPGTIGSNPAADDGPASASDSGSDTGRKRGRPRGSTNRARASETGLDLSGLQAVLSSTHIVLATISKNPMWALDDKEAKELASALQNVARHHDVAVAQKTLDYINLCAVAGMVYGTRIFAMQQARKDANAKPGVDAAVETHARGAANVHPFQPG